MQGWEKIENYKKALNKIMREKIIKDNGSNQYYAAFAEITPETVCRFKNNKQELGVEVLYAIAIGMNEDLEIIQSQARQAAFYEETAAAK